VDGGLFLVALVVFIAYSVRVARQEVSASEAAQFAEHAEARDLDAPGGRGAHPALWLPVLVLAVGIAALVAGGHFLVEGAVTLARLAGVTERVIGLTVVAVGTGMPELATSIVAAARGRTDVAVANMIGSNIFNVLGILGVTAMVSRVPVAPAIVHGDMRWMLGTCLLLLPLLRSGARISRGEGSVLVLAYAAYLIVLLRG
jgi:cation:H+ antiporter